MEAEALTFEREAIYKKTQMIAELLASNSHQASAETFLCLVYLIMCKWHADGLSKTAQALNMGEMMSCAISLIGEEADKRSFHTIEAKRLN